MDMSHKGQGVFGDFCRYINLQCINYITNSRNENTIVNTENH